MKNGNFFFKNGLVLLFGLSVFVSCQSNDEDSVDNTPNTPIEVTEGQFDLFNLKDLPSIELTVQLKDWNKILSNYDLNPNNDKKVPSSFQFVLNGKQVKIDSIGIRLRGNTSRVRPEGDFGQTHSANAPDWHHCHFALDFSKYRDAQRFSGLSSLNLKWFKEDPNYVREIYSYDLFKKYGVWTAPKASYCRLTIKVAGDVKPAYYGVYAMIESVSEDYLAARSGHWGSTVGYLWKGEWSGGDNADFIQNHSMGVTDVKLDDSQSVYYAYDLKTREDEVEAAKVELKQFISDLNTKSGADFQQWIASKMDISLFLKTYATNVMLGMWDDYWINGNNFYFYFGGDGKYYFIPYDYDNSLGTSGIIANSGTQDPLNWGDGRVKPLITKILAIPEYKAMYKQYLKELISPTSDLFDATKSINRIMVWKNLINTYVPNDTGEDMSIYDYPASWGNAPFYRLYSGNDQGGANGEANFFKTKAKTITW